MHLFQKWKDLLQSFCVFNFSDDFEIYLKKFEWKIKQICCWVIWLKLLFAALKLRCVPIEYFPHFIYYCMDTWNRFLQLPPFRKKKEKLLYFVLLQRAITHSKFSLVHFSGVFSIIVVILKIKTENGFVFSGLKPLWCALLKFFELFIKHLGSVIHCLSALCFMSHLIYCQLPQATQESCSEIAFHDTHFSFLNLDILLKLCYTGIKKSGKSSLSQNKFKFPMEAFDAKK